MQYTNVRIYYFSWRYACKNSWFNEDFSLNLGQLTANLWLYWFEYNALPERHLNITNKHYTCLYTIFWEKQKFINFLLLVIFRRKSQKVLVQTINFLHRWNQEGLCHLSEKNRVYRYFLQKPRLFPITLTGSLDDFFVKVM